MNTILIIWAVLVSATIMVGMVFAIMAFIQVRRTAQQAEILLRKINEEMSSIGRLTDTISAFMGNFTSPWVKTGSWIVSLITSMIRKKRRERADEAED